MLHNCSCDNLALEVKAKITDELEFHADRTLTWYFKMDYKKFIKLLSKKLKQSFFTGDMEEDQIFVSTSVPI